MTIREFTDMTARTWKFNHDKSYESKETEIITLALALGGEVGELQNVITRMYRKKYHTSGHSMDGVDENLKAEVADVLFFLLRLSDALGIDLEKAFREKMEVNFKRYNSPEK